MSNLPPFVADALEKFTEEDLARMRLSRDVFFDKIPQDLVEDCVRYSIHIGEELAERVVKRFGVSDPLLIAKEIGVEVSYAIRSEGWEGTIVRSESNLLRSTSNIYENSISQLKDLVSRYQLDSIFPMEAIGDMHVAHELFHHLEHKFGLDVGCSVRVTTFKLGQFQVTSGINSLDDVAAQAFSKTLLHLKRSPELLDKITSELSLAERPQIKEGDRYRESFRFFLRNIMSR